MLAQTYRHVELLVVDDCSTDDSASLLAAIDDPRLRVIRLDANRGAAGARNAGIRQARGELVAFQDSDDEWLPHKLEQQLAVLDTHGSEIGAVAGRYTVAVGPEPLRMVAPRLELGCDYEADLLDGRCMITPLWLVRRALLDELGCFDEGMACLEDWDLLLRLSQRTLMRAVPDTLLLKYGAPDSLGGDIRRRPPAMEQLLARHGERFLAYPERHASYCLELAYLWLLNGRDRRAVRYSLRAFERRGASRRLLLGFLNAAVRARVLHRPVTWPVFEPIG